MLKIIREDWNSWGLYFLVYCFIGWLYEVLVYAFELGYGYVNRGFLFGPWLPVYGFGGMLIILSMRSLRKHRIQLGRVNLTPLVCFLAIVLLCTSVELLTSYLMEWITGSWLWDYTKDGPNFQGRIALKSSLRFGLIGIVGLYGIQPAMEKGSTFMKEKYTKGYRFCSILLILLFLLDAAARFPLGGNYVGP